MLSYARNAVWHEAHFSAQGSWLVAVTLTVILHWSLVALQHNVAAGRWLRRTLLPITLYFLADGMLNRDYSLGSALRDSAFLAFGWHLLAKALEVGLVFDMDLKEGKPLPRWCVPDWQKEEEERKKEDESNCNEQKEDQCFPSIFKPCLKPCWWQRSMKIRHRPQWAKAERTIPRHWQLLPLPTHFADQILWTLDVMFLRLVGTSPLFVNEMRALDWSRKKLVAAGEAQFRRRLAGHAHDRPTRLTKELEPFGFVEMRFLHMLADLCLLIWAVNYYNSLDYPLQDYNSFFLNVPFRQQCLLSIATGTVIGISQGPIEYFLVPLMVNWPFSMPPTAVVPSFRDVARSQSISEMWGWRWHKRSQRDFLRLSRLLPIGSPNNRIALMLKVFFWSGLYHSMILLREGPELSWRKPYSTIIKPTILRPGTMGFFMVNGIVCLLETAAAPLLVRLAARFITAGRPRHARSKVGNGTAHVNDTGAIIDSGKLDDDVKIVMDAEAAAAGASGLAGIGRHWRCYVLWLVRIVWVWGFLIWTGRWLAAEIYAAGYMQGDVIRSMSIRAQIHDHWAYIRNSLGLD